MCLINYTDMKSKPHYFVTGCICSIPCHDHFKETASKLKQRDRMFESCKEIDIRDILWVPEAQKSLNQQVMSERVVKVTHSSRTGLLVWAVKELLLTGRQGNIPHDTVSLRFISLPAFASHTKPYYMPTFSDISLYLFSADLWAVGKETPQDVLDYTDRCWVVAVVRSLMWCMRPSTGCWSESLSVTLSYLTETDALLWIQIIFRVLT